MNTSGVVDRNRGQHWPKVVTVSRFETRQKRRERFATWVCRSYLHGKAQTGGSRLSSSGRWGEYHTQCSSVCSQKLSASRLRVHLQALTRGWMPSEQGTQILCEHPLVTLDSMHRGPTASVHHDDVKTGAFCPAGFKDLKHMVWSAVALTEVNSNRKSEVCSKVSLCSRKKSSVARCRPVRQRLRLGPSPVAAKCRPREALWPAHQSQLPGGGSFDLRQIWERTHW